MIVGGVALLGALTGYLLGRLSGGRAAAVLAVILAALAVGLLIMGRGAQGWDAIGYGIGALIFATPAALGVALGGWLGARQRRR